MRKVIILDEIVIKRNEKYIKRSFTLNIANLFSIKHKREVRFYRYSQGKKFLYLKTPKLISYNNQFIVIEKLNGVHFISQKDTYSVVPSLFELGRLGQKFHKNIGDYISSPTLSIIRMLLVNVFQLGLLEYFRYSSVLISFMISKLDLHRDYFIHRDLSSSHNLVNTIDGVYLYDFGESIITRKYFLADIVALSINLDTFLIDYDLIKYYLVYSGYAEKRLIQRQVFLLVLRKYLGYYRRLGKYNKSVLSDAYDLIFLEDILFSTN
jgi:tRNA A-37 threonylcarbamoyl transferase component Bud32